MKAQALIHWLEQGAGARWSVRVLALLGLIALSLALVYAQFRGPLSEETFRQVALGRALAEGNGFRSPVLYPQAVAVWQSRGGGEVASRGVPDMYSSPGYAMAVGAVLRLLPQDTRAKWFADAPSPPEGFSPDYLVLALNVGLLWLAAAQTWQLARRWFDGTVGAIAAVALLLSVGVWRHVLAVDGTALAMVLFLAVFQTVDRAQRTTAGRSIAHWSAAGLLLGGLFLTDYPYALLLGVIGASAFQRGRLFAVLALAVGFFIAAAPWLVRNTLVAGHPLALAAQEYGLRAGDPTAEPATVRTSFSTHARPVSLAKVANKGLAAGQSALADSLWTGGGLFLSAFFVASALYRFRQAETQRVRTLFLVSLAVLIVGQGVLNSGEAERPVIAVAVPLILVFGAGFFRILVASRPELDARPWLPIAGLLLLQGLPLLPEVLERRRTHFHYPPYYPALFQSVRAESDRAGSRSWMADLPAGAAWYAGGTVWAQPATMREFYVIHAERPVAALVLTPETLDQPFFSTLAARPAAAARWGEWADVYRGIAREPMPREFPLSKHQRVADNLYVLLDPTLRLRSGK